MSMDALLAKIADNPRLPSPPAIALQVLDRASKPSCTIADISKIISMDPPLCGRLLKLVNSALFGLPRSVASIDRALNLLGLNRVRSLVLSLTMPTLKFNNADPARMRDYWKVSVTEAMVVRQLATRLGWSDPDSEMVAGLLCDLGILILQETFPEQYAQIMAYPPEVLVTSQSELEDRVFGMNHADVGAYLLKKWRFPEEFTQPIRFHHRPSQLETKDKQQTDRAHLLYFASRISQLQLTVTQTAVLGEIVSIARDRYGMDDVQFSKFLDNLNQKIDEFASLIEVDLGSCPQYSTLFANATENLTRLAVEASIDNFRVHEEKARAEAGLKQAEEALHRTEEQLRQSQKLEAIGRLAGGVAHDFNNVLTVIAGYCELLLSPHPQDATYLIDQIKKAADRGANLTRQLLAFSRKQVMEPEVLSLAGVIRGMKSMIKRMIGEDVDLEIRMASDLKLIKADPSQLEQVIMNLAVNARDAMPVGGTFSVCASNVVIENDTGDTDCVLAPGEYVVLTVTDTGCGMDTATMEKMFEPFFTTKSRGTGLGLATVHGIVKQSGGHISVSSELGKGTTFIVHLPVADESLKPTKVVTVLEDVPAGHGTILITEDQDSVRDMARRSLQQYGYTVLEATSGREALRCVEEHGSAIDLLISDMVMPHMGGCELAQRIRSQHPRVKVLYTSGYSDDSILRNGMLTSSAPFLQKPFGPKKLAMKVHEILTASPVAGS
ncbi:MAG: HDOD domain-containing protein [Gemmataceae bacterium]